MNLNLDGFKKSLESGESMEDAYNTLNCRKEFVQSINSPTPLFLASLLQIYHMTPEQVLRAIKDKTRIVGK